MGVWEECIWKPSFPTVCNFLAFFQITFLFGSLFWGPCPCHSAHLLPPSPWADMALLCMPLPGIYYLLGGNLLLSPLSPLSPCMTIILSSIGREEGGGRTGGGSGRQEGALGCLPGHTSAWPAVGDFLHLSDILKEDKKKKLAWHEALPGRRRRDLMPFEEGGKDFDRRTLPKHA